MSVGQCRSTRTLRLPEVGRVQQHDEPQGAVRDGVPVVGHGRRVQISHRRYRLLRWRFGNSSSISCFWQPCSSVCDPFLAFASAVLDVLRHFLHDVAALSGKPCWYPCGRRQWPAVQHDDVRGGVWAVERVDRENELVGRSPQQSDRHDDCSRAAPRRCVFVFARGCVVMSSFGNLRHHSSPPGHAGTLFPRRRRKIISHVECRRA